jgi:preprotein translocase subunit SecB
MENDNRKLNLASAVKVSERVDLQSVKLLTCDCKQKPKSTEGPNTFAIEKTCRFEVDKEKNIVGAFIQFTLNAFGEGVEQKKENSFLVIDATFLLLYHIRSTEGLDDEAFSSFAEANGVYNAWPYWREFVQSVTSRMGLPTLTVPVFRISSVLPKTADKKTEAPATT